MPELLRISNADYHGDTTRISNSGLKEISRSPAHYWHKYLNPKREPEPPTAALVSGSAFHAIVLEPEVFGAEFVVMPKMERRSNAGKAAAELWESENAGKTIITTEQHSMVSFMRDAVLSNPVIAELLKAGGIVEGTAHFTHPDSGVLCKIRPDFLTASGDWILDLKSTEDASPDGFGRSAAQYRYHVQAPYYLDGLKYAGFRRPKGFIFAAVEKSPPYCVGVYVVPLDVLERGREIYNADLDTLAHCQATNHWPGYSPGIETLRLPRWALRSE